MYEELPGPEVKQPGLIKARPKVPGGPDNSRVGMGDKLIDGVYDEGVSHNGFLEALNAFRGKEKEKTPV
jgi:hypothetical protein